MAYCEDVVVRDIPQADYARVVREVVDSGPDEPRYGEVDADQLGLSWSTFVSAKIGTVLGAYKHDKCVGFIFGLCSHDPLTGEKYGTAYFWAVMPEHRAGGVAYKLLDEFERWTKQQGGVVVCVGVIHSPKAEKLVRAHRRKGFKLTTLGLTKRIG